MASHKNNIYLLREAIEFGKKIDNKLLYLDINIFKSKLIYSLKDKLNDIDNGFYINDNGDFLIDRLVNQSKDGSSSNASRKWNVETLKLIGDSFKSVSIRDYDVRTYERLK